MPIPTWKRGLRARTEVAVRGLGSGRGSVCEPVTGGPAESSSEVSALRCTCWHLPSGSPALLPSSSLPLHLLGLRLVSCQLLPASLCSGSLPSLLSPSLSLCLPPWVPLFPLSLALLSLIPVWIFVSYKCKAQLDLVTQLKTSRAKDGQTVPGQVTCVAYLANALG